MNPHLRTCTCSWRDVHRHLPLSLQWWIYCWTALHNLWMLRDSRWGQVSTWRQWVLRALQWVGKRLFYLRWRWLMSCMHSSWIFGIESSWLLVLVSTCWGQRVESLLRNMHSGFWNKLSSMYRVFWIYWWRLKHRLLLRFQSRSSYLWLL